MNLIIGIVIGVAVALTAGAALALREMVLRSGVLKRKKENKVSKKNGTHS